MPLLNAHRQKTAPVCCAWQFSLTLLVCAEAIYGHGCYRAAPERQRCHMSAHGFHYLRRFQDAYAAPAYVFAQADAAETCFGEFGVGVAVEPVACVFHLFDAFGRDTALQNLVGQFGHCLLTLVKTEIHCLRFLSFFLGRGWRFCGLLTFLCDAFRVAALVQPCR